MAANSTHARLQVHPNCAQSAIPGTASSSFFLKYFFTNSSAYCILLTLILPQQMMPRQMMVAPGGSLGGGPVGGAPINGGVVQAQPAVLVQGQVTLNLSAPRILLLHFYGFQTNVFLMRV